MAILEGISVKKETVKSETIQPKSETRRNAIKKITLALTTIAGILSGTSLGEKFTGVKIEAIRPKLIGDAVLKDYKEKLPKELFSARMEYRPIIEIQQSDINRFKDNPPIEVSEYLAGTEKARKALTKGLFSLYSIGYIRFEENSTSEQPQINSKVKEKINGVAQKVIDGLIKSNPATSKIWELSGDTSENTVLTNDDAAQKIIDHLRRTSTEADLGIYFIPSFIRRDPENGIEFDSYTQIDAGSKNLAYQDLEIVIKSRVVDSVNAEDYIDWVNEHWGNTDTVADPTYIAGSIAYLIGRGFINWARFKREVDNISAFVSEIEESKSAQNEGAMLQKDPVVMEQSLTLAGITELLRSKFPKALPNFTLRKAKERIDSTRETITVNLTEVKASIPKIGRRAFLKVSAAFALGAIIGVLRATETVSKNAYNGAIEVFRKSYPEIGMRINIWISMFLKEDVFDRIPGSTRVLSSDGEVIFKYSPTWNREYKAFDELKTQNPELYDFLCKLVTIEDKNFWNHDGVDPEALAVGFATKVIKGQDRGGSTITQQAIKNVCYYLQDSEAEINRNERKAIELFAAPAIEIAYIEKFGSKKLAKEKILEIYFNAISFGPYCIGIQTASRDIFGKDLQNITKQEAVFLFSLIQDPLHRYPFSITDGTMRQDTDNLANAISATKASIGSLLARGLISKAEADTLLINDIPTLPTKNEVDQLSLKAINNFINNAEANLWIQGVDIVTTIDSKLQKELHDAVEAERPTINASGAETIISIIKNRDGEIVAYDGDIFLQRQVGSSSKPLIYAAAYARKILDTPNSLVDDSSTVKPYSIKLKNGIEYSPTSYGENRHGVTTAKIALSNSYNVVPIKFMEELGLDYGKLLVKARLLDQNNLDYTSLPAIMPLGIFASSPERLSNLPLLLVNDGKLVDTSFISSVTSKDGTEVYQRKKRNYPQLISTKTAGIVRDLISYPGVNVLQKSGTSTSVDPSKPGDLWVSEALLNGKYAYVTMATNPSTYENGAWGKPLYPGVSSATLYGLNKDIRTMLLNR